MCTKAQTKYSSSHTLHFPGFCMTLQTGIVKNDRLMRSYNGNRACCKQNSNCISHMSNKAQCAAPQSIWTLNLHLENLWLTILDILFYCIYDSSKSNNAVYVPYIFLCMSQSSHVSSIPQTCRLKEAEIEEKITRKAHCVLCRDYHKAGRLFFFSEHTYTNWVFSSRLTARG